MLIAPRLDVPVTPDPDQARRWLADELAKPDYNQGPSLLEVIVRWVREQLARLLGALDQAPGGIWLYLVAALVIVGLVVTLLVLGPVRARRHAATPGAVLIDETRTAEQMRAAARAAAERGEWTQATIEQFRAIVRGLEERAILNDKPGRTAHEVAPDTAGRLPDQAAQLARAGDRFDEIAYGGAAARRSDFEEMARLDELVAAARPALRGDQLAAAP